RPRHVTAILQDRDEGEQDENLRQKYEHGTDAFDDAVYEQAAKGARVQRLFHEIREGFLTGGDAVHERLGPREDRLEDQEHHAEKDQRAPDLVSEDTVEAV